MWNRPSSPVWILAGLITLLAGAGVGWWMALPPGPPDPPVAIRPVPRVEVIDGQVQQAGEKLHDLRIGMSRAEVETILGRPSPADIDPVDRSTGRAVFRTRYLVYLTSQIWFAPDARGHCDVVLEFDASRPGHPLTKLACVARGTDASVGASRTTDM